MNESAFDKDQRMRAYALEIIAAAVDSRVANATLTNFSWVDRKAKDAARRRFRTIASGNALSLAYYVLAEDGGNFEDDVRAAIEAKRAPASTNTEAPEPYAK